MATSMYMKALLFALFGVMVCSFCLGLYSVAAAGYDADLPGECLSEARYLDSWQQNYYQRDVVTSLFWKQDMVQESRYGKSPALYYRAEYPDGSVTTNAPAGSGKAFFEARSYYQVWRTQTDGYWENPEGTPGHGAYHPQPIYRENAQGTYVSYTYITNDFGVTYRVDDSSHVVSKPAKASHTAPNDVASSMAAGDSETPTMEEPAPLMPEMTEPDPRDVENEYGWSENTPCPVVTVYYAYDDAALAAYQDYWQQCRIYMLQQIMLLGGLALGALAAALWLLITCGRRPADRELHLLAFDRTWTEVTLGLTALLFVGAVSLCIAGVQHLIFQGMREDAILSTFYPVGVTLLSLLTLLGCMSLMRLLKARRFIRNSLTFQVLYWCWKPFGKCIDLLRGCFDQRSFKNAPPAKAMVQRFVVLMGSVYAILLVFGFVISAGISDAAPFGLVVLVGLLTLPLAWWHLRGLQKSTQALLDQVDESHTQQAKSEGTKTALITNVSHDLKTPLTSIITYVDLLQKEELSDTARDYVTVLAQKSERLKLMVSDLFDLSKSTSGNLPLDPEVLDMKRLLEQTLADMDDSIQQSGLQLRSQLPDSPLYIYSDGKKLYRVFQNLIGNAVKYGMTGTRVFVTLERDGSLAVASIKNTASYEMNFTPEEILQRFSRGDQSRTGEGSGLGLSIAESFTAACGGQFNLAIDGDFFKVTVTFPLTDREPVAEAPEEKVEMTT